MKEQSKFLSLKYIKEGTFGYAKFAKEYLLKNMVICTDASRRILIYKDENNKKKVDIKGLYILKEIGIAIKDINKKICTERRIEIKNQAEMDSDAVLEKINCQEYIIEINKMSNGDKPTNFVKKFLDDLCAQLKS